MYNIFLSSLLSTDAISVVMTDMTRRDQNNSHINFESEYCKALLGNLTGP